MNDEGYRERDLTEDFYLCPNTGNLVYRWTDERYVLVTSDEARDASAELSALKAHRCDGCALYMNPTRLVARCERLYVDVTADFSCAAWTEKP